MMLKFSRSNLAKSQEGPWLLLDMAMLGLLIINLVWIILDSLYATSLVQGWLKSISPAIVDAYAPVHANFRLIDLCFIAVFLTEFCIRWAVSVYGKEHLRWYFYPFVHWYDLVGCIPVSGARILRLLRVISILYRLHKYQIIDLHNTALFRFVKFYVNVIVEELSDRIVVKVLSDAQKDISAGSPLIQDVVEQVLASRQQVIYDWAANLMTHLGESIQHPERGEAFRQHVTTSVGRAVTNNAQVSNLNLFPVVGSQLEKMLEKAVTDIVTQSIVHLLTDITPEKLHQALDQTVSSFKAQNEAAFDQEILLVVNECLELVKEHVSTQRWKEELEKRDEYRP